MIKKIVLFVISVFALFYACDKEEELSNPEMLANHVGKKWVISKIWMDTVDITGELDACELDNEEVYFSDYTYLYTEGDSTCGGSSTDSIKGSWEFNVIKTTLKVVVDEDTTEYIIKALSKNQMSLYYIDQYDGMPYTVIYKTK